MDDFSLDMTPEDKLEQARRHIVAKEYAQARPLVMAVLKEDRKNTMALWMYANLMRSESPEKAAKALDQLLLVQPDHAKAQALLNKLRPDDDPFGDDDPFDSPSSRSRQQPVINVTVQNTANQNTGMPMMGMAQGRNDTAFIVGIIAGLVFGIWGMAHILNNKVMSGIGWWAVGWFVWVPVAGLIVTFTAGLGACLILPLHIYLIVQNSKQGAAMTQMPVMAAMPA